MHDQRFRWFHDTCQIAAIQPAADGSTGVCHCPSPGGAVYMEHLGILNVVCAEVDSAVNASLTL